MDDELRDIPIILNEDCPRDSMFLMIDNSGFPHATARGGPFDGQNLMVGSRVVTWPPESKVLYELDEEDGEVYFRYVGDG